MNECRRLRVLHVARNPLTGVWSAMKCLAKAQVEAGYEVRFALLLTRGWPHRNEIQELGIKYWITDSPCVSGTAAFLYHRFVNNPVPSWVDTFATESKAKSIIVHYHDGWRAGALCLQHHQTLQLTQLSTFHGIGSAWPLEQQPMRRLVHRNWARRLCRCGCTLVSVDSGNLEDGTAKRLFGLESGIFTVIPNGAPCTTGGQEKHGDAPTLRVGHVGIINEDKGWRITAEAIEALLKEGKAIHYTIAGSGPQEEEARIWCATKGLGNSAFLGEVPNAGQTVLPTLDILCLPTRKDGLPMAILEAMSCGVVVIATAVGGIPNVVEHEKTGLLVQRNSEAVRIALRRLASDRSTVSRMRENAIKRHKLLYSPEVMRHNYERAYTSCRQET